MGKIIRNGVEYSGAVEAATAVNYDGSVSGLKAQTVQEAIDELSANDFHSPDYTRILAEINTRGASYTAEENGWLVGYIEQNTTGGSPIVFVNSVQVMSIYDSAATRLGNVYTPIPIAKGDIIQTRVDYGSYDLKLYGDKTTGGSRNGSGESLEWNKLSDNGNNAIALPTDWKEFVISITHGGSTISNHYVNGISFGNFIRFGFYGSSTDVLRAWFSLQNNTITIGELNYNGNTVQKTDFTYEVLYR